jgi:hypothetical protein
MNSMHKVILFRRICVLGRERFCVRPVELPLVHSGLHVLLERGADPEEIDYVFINHKTCIVAVLRQIIVKNDRWLFGDDRTITPERLKHTIAYLTEGWAIIPDHLDVYDMDFEELRKITGVELIKSEKA